MRKPSVKHLTDEQLTQWYPTQYTEVKEAHPEADEATLLVELRKVLLAMHDPLTGPACNAINAKGESVNIEDPAVKDAWMNGGPGFENPFCLHCEKDDSTTITRKSGIKVTLPPGMKITNPD